MCNATVLQAFAAGAALSSTSLGTTFSILKSSGLEKSRLGIVLTSAAMLDDIVGLVLVQIISNLGAIGEGGFTATTIIRPVFVSIAYACLLPALLFIWKTIQLRVRVLIKSNTVGKTLTSSRGQLVFQTAILISAVASAGYAGTSVLFAAYLAGALVTGCESLTDDQKTKETPKSTAAVENRHVDQPALMPTSENAESWELVSQTPNNSDAPDMSAASSELPPSSLTNDSDTPNNQPRRKQLNEDGSEEKREKVAHVPEPQAPQHPKKQDPDQAAAAVFDKFYAQPLNKLLKPFFFVRSQYPKHLTTRTDTSFNRHQ